MILQQLAYKISIDAGGFLTGKKKVESEAKGLTESIAKSNKNAGKSFDSLTIGVQRFGNVGKSAFSQVQIGAAKFLGVALSLEGARRVFMSTTNTMISMGASSKYLGLSIRSLDGWTKAAQSAGVAGDSVKNVLSTLKSANIWKTSGLGGAPDGATQALLQLNPSIIDEANPDKALRLTAEALRKQPESRAQGLWAQIGGDPALFNLLMRGDLNSLVDQYTAKSDKSDAMYKQALKVKEVLTNLDSTVESLTDRLTLAFGPKVIEGLQTLDDWISQNKGGILGFFSDMASSAKALTEAMGGIQNLLVVYAGYKVGGLPGAAAAAAGVTVYDSGVAISDAATSADDTDSLWDSIKQRWRAGGWAGNEELKAEALRRGMTPSQILDERDRKNGGSSYDSIMSIFGIGGANASSSVPRGASPELMDAIRMVESGGGKHLYSSAGAVGDYQLMAGTARDLGLKVGGGVDERLDPAKSRAASTKYMAQLLQRYGGNTTNALRAYNWGMGNMDKFLAGEIKNMPQETIDYPHKIAQHYKGINAMAIGGGSSQMMGSGDQTNINIQNVTVDTNPTTANQLADDIMAQVQRSRTNVVFNNGNRP